MPMIRLFAFHNLLSWVHRLIHPNEIRGQKVSRQGRRYRSSCWWHRSGRLKFIRADVHRAARDAWVAVQIGASRRERVVLRLA